MRNEPTSPSLESTPAWPTARAFCAALLVMLATAVLTGCASRYKITLNNGNMITTRSKPKYDADHGVYRFKDLQGTPTYLPAFRIKEISPM